MGGVLSRFSFATATTIQQLKNSFNSENTVKSTAFWVSVHAEIENKHGQTSQMTIPFH